MAHIIQKLYFNLDPLRIVFSDSLIGFVDLEENSRPTEPFSFFHNDLVMDELALDELAQILLLFMFISSFLSAAFLGSISYVSESQLRKCILATPTALLIACICNSDTVRCSHSRKFLPYQINSWCTFQYAKT